MGKTQEVGKRERGDKSPLGGVVKRKKDKQDQIKLFSSFFSRV